VPLALPEELSPARCCERSLTLSFGKPQDTRSLLPSALALLRAKPSCDVLGSKALAACALKLVTHRMPLSHAQRALEMAAASRAAVSDARSDTLACVKVMLHPDAQHATERAAAGGGGATTTLAASLD
jgi:hypothetical protein